MAATSSLRPPAARRAQGLHSRRRQAGPLPTPAEHARHRPYRHLPRRAPGQGASELAVHAARTRQAWRENGKLVWTDPSQPKVQDYNIALAKHVAQLGADEIQFDYVRFPAEGDQKDAQFVFQGRQPEAAAEVASTPECRHREVDKTCGDGRLPSRRSEARRNLHELSEPSPSRAGSYDSPNSSPEGAAFNSPGRKSRVAKKKETSPGGTAPAHAPPPRGPKRTDVITAFLKRPTPNSTPRACC